MGVATGCGCRYIDFLILLIPTPLVSVLFAAASLLFVHFVKCFSFFNIYSKNYILLGIFPKQYYREGISQ